MRYCEGVCACVRVRVVRACVCWLWFVVACALVLMVVRLFLVGYCSRLFVMACAIAYVCTCSAYVFVVTYVFVVVYLCYGEAFIHKHKRPTFVLRNAKDRGAKCVRSRRTMHCFDVCICIALISAYAWLSCVCIVSTLYGFDVYALL